MQPQPVISAGVANVMGAGVGPQKVSLLFSFYYYNYHYYCYYYYVSPCSCSYSLSRVSSFHPVYFLLAWR